MSDLNPSYILIRFSVLLNLTMSATLISYLHVHELRVKELYCSRYLRWQHEHLNWVSKNSGECVDNPEDESPEPEEPTLEKMRWEIEIPMTLGLLYALTGKRNVMLHTKST